MEFEELRTLLGNELKRRFWENKAMPAISQGRVAMDGWLKVELAAILAERGEVEPAFKLPKGKAAVRAGGWLVDAVSLPTDFAYENTKAGPKTLEDDVRDLRKLIKRLRKGRGKDQAAVMIAVYPFGDLHEKAWAMHKARIEKALGGKLVEDRFSFQSGVTGRLYAGVVMDKVKARILPAAKAQSEAGPAGRRHVGRPRKVAAAPAAEVLAKAPEPEVTVPVS